MLSYGLATNMKNITKEYGGINMKVLVIVDMQNDFISGSLGTKEAQEILPKVIEKAEGFCGEIVATFDTHDESYLKTQEGRLLPVKHCVEGTDGWCAPDALIDAIADNEAWTSTFRKKTFGSVELGEYLRIKNSVSTDIDEVILVGLCTDICVISNALLLKAFLPEVKITVDAACCAGVTPESHANALAAMKMCQINVENWEG